MVPKRFLLILLITAGVSIAAWARADQPAPAKAAADKQEAADRFVRLQRGKGRTPLALQTAVVRCVPQDCGRTAPSVDLIAAIHVADKAYYAQLNRLFEDYDAVLYEMVAPQGVRIPKGGGPRSSHPVSMAQRIMSDVLELQYQLEGIDYTRKNLVHADMSPDQFAKSMRDRGESIWTILLRMMGYAMARQGAQSDGPSDVRLLMALLSKDRALALKRLMAEQFEDLQGSINALEGAEGSTLISERNKVALDVLRKQIAAGKRKVAIFYGGGHMPDFEKRLKDDFGLVRVGQQWLTAWEMQGKEKPERARKDER